MNSPRKAVNANTQAAQDQDTSAAQAQTDNATTASDAGAVPALASASEGSTPTPKAAPRDEHTGRGGAYRRNPDGSRSRIEAQG